MNTIFVVYNYHLNDNGIRAFTSRLAAVKYINDNKQLPLAYYPITLESEEKVYEIHFQFKSRPVLYALVSNAKHVLHLLAKECKGTDWIAFDKHTLLVFEALAKDYPKLGPPVSVEDLCPKAFE